MKLGVACFLGCYFSGSPESQAAILSPVIPQPAVSGVKVRAKRRPKKDKVA